MTITEALKEIKFLEKKINDKAQKLRAACCEMDYSGQPFTYGDESEQRAVVNGLQQSIVDMTNEIERLSISVNKTNLETNVSVNGKERSIASWILRRRKLCSLEVRAWNSLTDNGLKPQAQSIKNENGESVAVVTNPKKFYDEKKKNEVIESLENEANEIDGKLEVVNATTTLISL